MQNRAVTGQGLASGGRAPETFRLGRTCGFLGCHTKLSIYNKERYCALHGPKVAQRLLDRR